MNEIELTRALCEQYGYGHIMGLASALWRKKLKESDTPISGAFVPVLSYDVKDGVNTDDILYDTLVEKNITQLDWIKGEKEEVKKLQGNG